MRSTTSDVAERSTDRSSENKPIVGVSKPRPFEDFDQSRFAGELGAGTGREGA